MFEFVRDELTSFSCQITDRLLSCMKVNADIYCVHSASFQSHVESTGREFTTRGRRRLLHNINLQVVLSYDLRDGCGRAVSFPAVDAYAQSRRLQPVLSTTETAAPPASVRA